MENYYYNQLNKIEKVIYQEMKTGLFSLKDKFLVPELDMRRLSEIYFFLRLDHPELFWAEGFKCRSYASSEYVQVFPEYMFEKGKILEQQKAMKARVEKICRKAEGMTLAEKEKYIHDFICENVKYDKLKKAYAHEIIGPLGHGVGVCEGIAKSVKILCDHMGLWCVIAISEANPEKNIKYRHAWNVIKMNGKFYHLDATFDRSITQDVIRYDYYHLGDAQIFKDHEPVIAPIPRCEDHGSFYYLTQKLSFTKMDMLEKRIRQAVKKNKTLVFQWRGGYLNKAVIEEILKMVHVCAGEKGKYAKLSMNYAQAVFQMNIVAQQKEEVFVVEETYEDMEETE